MTIVQNLSYFPFKPLITAILISPMIVPLVIIAAGMYFFYSKIGIAVSDFGIIVAHAMLGTPFVIITQPPPWQASIKHYYKTQASWVRIPCLPF